MMNESKNKLEKDAIIFEKLISKMNLEEKIGQMFQIGFDGAKITSDVEEMIKDYRVGGIIYFRRNIESIPQLSELSNELQKLSVNQGSGLPLIISIDQEGGIVNRIVGATHFPGSMVLGATRNTRLVKKIGQLIAKQLKALGINMNFAPVFFTTSSKVFSRASNVGSQKVILPLYPATAAFFTAGAVLGITI